MLLKSLCTLELRTRRIVSFVQPSSVIAGCDVHVYAHMMKYKLPITAWRNNARHWRWCALKTFTLCQSIYARFSPWLINITRTVLPICVFQINCDFFNFVEFFGQFQVNYFVGKMSEYLWQTLDHKSQLTFQQTSLRLADKKNTIYSQNIMCVICYTRVDIMHGRARLCACEKEEEKEGDGNANSVISAQMAVGRQGGERRARSFRRKR